MLKRKYNEKSGHRFSRSTWVKTRLLEKEINFFADCMGKITIFVTKRQKHDCNIRQGLSS